MNQRVARKVVKSVVRGWRLHHRLAYTRDQLRRALARLGYVVVRLRGSAEVQRLHDLLDPSIIVQCGDGSDQAMVGYDRRRFRMTYGPQGRITYMKADYAVCCGSPTTTRTTMK